jgi:hypothetical protein
MTGMRQAVAPGVRVVRKLRRDCCRPAAARRSVTTAQPRVASL